MIDSVRHDTVFDRRRFGNKRVDIIGAGSTGGKIAMSLAKLGITNVHVWDFDVVEKHNIANQIYGIGDIGKKKVVALREIIQRDTGTVIKTHDEAVDGSQPLGEVVFLLTDTMKSRKAIFEGAIKFKPGVKMMFETRMGVDNGRVYAINPCSVPETEEWEKTLFSDEEAVPSACRAQVSVGSTADEVAGKAVGQFIRWFQIENGANKSLHNEVVFTPDVLLNRKFK